MDIMISFDVFYGISDQYFVEKNQTNFFAKKSCQKFSSWNLMLPENEVDTSKCQCATTAKGLPFWIATFFEIPKININV